MRAPVPLVTSPLSADELVGDTPLDRQLLPVADAVRRLGVGRTTLYRLLSERQIVAESIDRFIAGLARWGVQDGLPALTTADSLSAPKAGGAK